MTRQLEKTAAALAVKLHAEGGPIPWLIELLEMERALALAPLVREGFEDIPRAIELEKHEARHETAAWDDWTAGWNAACDQNAALARFMLNRPVLTGDEGGENATGKGQETDKNS